MVGGNFPVSVQTMWKSPLKHIEIEKDLEKRINRLSNLGCNILRFAVPCIETAEILGKIAQQHVHKIPIVADVHFDYKIALRCMDFPIAKIRINPGNIGDPWKVEEVVRKARDRGISLRVGVNSGSLPKSLALEKDIGIAMLKAAEEELEILEKLNFKDVIFSLKASSIDTTINANILFSEKYKYPLHIGITEAGPLVPGIVKSTITIKALLDKGIGDTIRVSISDSPENEVITGCEILKSCGLRHQGINIVSCPTCGRAVFDVKGFLKQVCPFLHEQKKNITVAIMGCPVNGPGEAKHANIGITGSDKYAVIFKEGKIIRRYKIQEAMEAFKEEISKCKD